MKRIIVLFTVVLSMVGCAGFRSDVEYANVASFDSERVAYNVYGEGETALIFIHGWSCDSRYWLRQVKPFSENYKVITVDLPGHGNASMARKDYKIESYAEDIKAVIEKEQISRAVLVGHSMGGSVVTKSANLMPDKVIGIIGVDTLQNVGEDVPQQLIDDMISPLEADFVTAAKDFVIQMIGKNADPELIEWICEDMSSAPSDIAINEIRHYLNQLRGGAFAQVIAKVDVPVVCINARLWPTKFEENKKHINDYKLLYVEDSGHFPMLEQPDEFNARLTEALEYIEKG